MRTFVDINIPAETSAEELRKKREEIKQLLGERIYRVNSYGRSKTEGHSIIGIITEDGTVVEYQRIRAAVRKLGLELDADSYHHDPTNPV